MIFFHSNLAAKWKHRNLVVKVLRLLHSGLGFESQAIQFIADCTFLQLSILNKIKPHKTAWRIQVKITHTWRHFMKDVGESMELILCDANVSLTFNIDFPFLEYGCVKKQANRYIF